MNKPLPRTLVLHWHCHGCEKTVGRGINENVHAKITTDPSSTSGRTRGIIELRSEALNAPGGWMTVRIGNQPLDLCGECADSLANFVETLGL